MLVAIVAAILMALGGDPADATAFERAAEVVERRVPDRDRRDAAVELLGRMQETVEEMAAPPRPMVRTVVDLLRRHRVAAADLRRALEPLEHRRIRLEERLVAMRMLLRTYLTAEEWAEAFPSPEG